MKNVSSIKSSNKIESPKTPGGISKSLLTPCRRVGLSRNWRKSGPSPFVSPLAGSTEVKLEKKDDVQTKRETRKRKERPDETACKAETAFSPLTKDIVQDVVSDELPSVLENVSVDIETTPSRNVSVPRKKKSKTLSSRMNSDNADMKSPKICDSIENIVTTKVDKLCDDNSAQHSFDSKIDVDTPVRTKSKSKIKNTLETKVTEMKEKVNSNTIVQDSDLKDESKDIEQKPNDVEWRVKPKSPDKLTKECIVVIQKKIYKKDLEKLKQKVAKDEESKKCTVNPVSQALFDSDNDDVPLSVLNKEPKSNPKLKTFNDDDDFVETTKVKIKKLEDKTTSIGGLKNNSNKKKHKLKKENLPHSNASSSKHIELKNLDSKPSSQSSLDDDEDFVMDNRRTILIKKCYDKVTKPLKAKSTGSITQKDIDDLKMKIEMKKKLLLAKAVTEDTEELRDLIKKWQKGCQDALMELMELMKTKFPDKQNMDYSEILQTLKIPASLVGYDEENDCFGTPTDENIVLSKFNVM